MPEMVQVGTNTALAAANASANAATQAVLTLKAGSNEAGRFVPLMQNQVWVLRAPAEKALVDAGMKAPANGNAMQTLVRACSVQAPQCQTGMRAIQAGAVSRVTTDASGQAQTQALPVGRYYVFSTAMYKQRPMFWQVPVDLRAGQNAVALDLSNAHTVD